jgi:hypothetical protein
MLRQSPEGHPNPGVAFVVLQDELGPQFASSLALDNPVRGTARQKVWN